MGSKPGNFWFLTQGSVIIGTLAATWVFDSFSCSKWQVTPMETVMVIKKGPTLMLCINIYPTLQRWQVWKENLLLCSSYVDESSLGKELSSFSLCRGYQALGGPLGDTETQTLQEK